MQDFQTLKIINKSTYPLPAYATAGASGVDIQAVLPQPITLQPLERTLVPTGLFVQIPDGFELQVRPRSGLAIKKGLGLLNAPGTIDADYRGEIKVILVNLSNTPVEVSPGERIAQLVLMKVEKINFCSVEELEQTVRDQGGFGSTGV